VRRPSEDGAPASTPPPSTRRTASLVSPAVISSPLDYGVI